MVTGDDEHTQPSCPVRVVNTVGAGDGYAVGLISGMLDGLAPAAWAARANAIGAMAVTSRGDQDGLPTRQALEAFAMRLAHLGLPVAVLGETTIPPVERGDTLVAVSGSGTTHGTVHAARTAADQGARVVAVTTDQQAPLARLADHTLVVPAAQHASIE